MKKDTILVTAGRHPEQFHGAVNPPVYRFSTVEIPTVEELLNITNQNKYDKLFYGRLGSPTTRALEEAIAAIEGASHCVATPSGLSAITISLSAFLETGDHLLMTRDAYHAVREFCQVVLRRQGIKTTFYDPSIGSDILGLIQNNTRVVFCESPGSNTFVMQDIPAIVTAAHSRNCIVMADNTWATPLFFKPLSKGVDISILAGTKYIVGHSDAMLGTIAVGSRSHYLRIKDTAAQFGFCLGSEEAYLGLRGLRTLSVRLRQHMETGLQLATWLSNRPEVSRVIHPAMPHDPGYELWKRDFTGACGLFGIELEPCSLAGLKAMLDGLDYFAMGYSWGGFESLVLPMRGGVVTRKTEFKTGPAALRIHAGLEDIADLISDLEKGFKRLHQAKP